MSPKAKSDDTDTQPLVDARGLGVVFGTQTVLREIDLVVPRGETLVIIGESGCGKTVLMKTMIGLVSPTHGEMLFDGRNLQKLSEKELTEQRIRFGFVFQNAALFDSMTIEQNVAFPLRQHTNKTETEIHEIVLERLAEVGLSADVTRKKPAELSGGMRKRVGLARALTMNPDILLYDEPTTGLDPIMSDVIGELIVETRRKHPITSIVVTHDMRVAQKVADRIVMLFPVAKLEPDEPQILYDGRPERIEQSRDVRVGRFVRGESIGIRDSGFGIQG
jgi:phospholipid/cholesterol/gamma-HCH transport system ATP-binding protein